MSSEKGFTLIELVVVIIILGILAVTAAPKFIDLQGDARASTIQGMKAALESAATLTYSKAAIEGIEKSSTECLLLSGTATLDCSGDNEINIAFGYPQATERDLGIALETTFGDGSNGEEWDIDDSSSPGKAVIVLAGTDVTTECRVSYAETDDDVSRPDVTIEDSQC